MQFLNYHSDNPALGSGQRLVLVYNEKGLKVTLMDCASFRRVVVHKEELRYATPPRSDVTGASLAKVMRRTLKARKKAGVVSSSDAKYISGLIEQVKVL
jgi:hypothetical protein